MQRPVLKIAKRFIALFVLTLSADHSLADWDFDQFPNPRHQEYGAHEVEKFEKIQKKADELKTSACEDLLEVDFKFYHDRYPDFKSVGTVEKRYRLWRRHVVKNRRGWNPQCTFLLLGSVSQDL